jgi:hypothetical protein
MTKPFVPADFLVPESFQGTGFSLEPLGPTHNDRDHEAWMSSIDHIRSTPGFDATDADWPTPMSLEANLGDLIRHADDFESRVGFTYSILDGGDVIGCVYIYPSADPNHDAKVTSWVRKTHAPMDSDVREQLTVWLADVWPFSNPAYAPRTAL